MTTLALRDQTARVLMGTMLGIAISGIALGAVHSPFVVTGAVLGATVLVVALTAPLALVALMLVIGPVDLSFMTGGFKSLLPGLGGLDMNGIRLLGATAGFMAFIMFEPRARAAAWGALGKPWVIFLAYAATTLALSMDRLEGLRLLLKLSYPFLTFLIVVGVANSRDRIETLLRYTLAAALAYTVIINPLLAMNGGYRVDLDGSLRVGGLGSGDSPFAFYVTAMLMIAFTRFMLRRQFSYLLFSLLLITWVWLTGTRIAALAALVGMGVIGVLAAGSSGNRKMLVGAIFSVTLAAGIMVPKALQRSLGYVPNPAEFLQLVTHPLTLYNAVNWQGRELLWAILWGAFLSSPIVGLGLGSSTAVIVETFPNQSVRVAHNEYLRMATDSGVLGVGLMLAAFGAWLVALIRMSRLGNDAVREFTFPAIAVLLSWLLIAATDNAIDYYNNFSQYLGFLVAGAVVAFADAKKGQGRLT